MNHRKSYEEGQTILDSLNAQYDDIISWADMYDSANVEQFILGITTIAA